MWKEFCDWFKRFVLIKKYNYLIFEPLNDEIKQEGARKIYFDKLEKEVYDYCIEYGDYFFQRDFR
jgi:hypothetical protein